ncbi:MAG: sugar phosphate isomerase/epimerase [Bacteroidales bacterium]|nr:sugar phosphate isomerase/epimerase [Bacteroidales bacterium]
MMRDFRRYIIVYISVFLLVSPDIHAQIAGISCCDWMMLKRQKLGQFQLMKDIGGDGVEMDMGPLGRRVMFENRFRDNDKETTQFRQTAERLGIRVSSIAMSGFFAQTLIDRKFDEQTLADGTKVCKEHTASESDANYRSLIADCLNTMEAFGAKVAFLPLGGSGREWQKGEGPEYEALCSRLHTFGEMAHKRGLTIGIRTAMPAAFSKRMLDDINSSGIKIYYNFQDACDRFKAGHAPEAKTSTQLICDELRALGTRRVCQIHVSNTDSVTLRHDPYIDMPAVKKTLKKMRYRGWLTVERSRDAKNVRNVRANYGDNVAYLKEIFGR